MIVCDSCKKECKTEVVVKLEAKNAGQTAARSDDSGLWRGHLCKPCLENFTPQARQSLRELAKAVYVVPPETVSKPS